LVEKFSGPTFDDGKTYRDFDSAIIFLLTSGRSLEVDAYVSRTVRDLPKATASLYVTRARSLVEKRSRSTALLARRSAALAFDGIRRHTNASLRDLRVWGVYAPSGPLLAGRVGLLRPDQDLPASSPSPIGDGLSAYVFDAALPPPVPFGWEGCMTPDNNFANEALLRHVGAANAARIPSILVYGPESVRRPFFNEIASEFRHRVDRREPDLDAKIAALCGLEPAAAAQVA
jgi:hypothetical protein